MDFERIRIPDTGELIQVEGDALRVPDHVILPFIEGDGIGPDIWAASVRVFDAAVEASYGRERKIEWWEIFAGEKAVDVYGQDQWLPEDTLKAIRTGTVAIKGPLTTPVGGGIRSLNVSLRQFLDLYACVRPVKWVPGVPSPVKYPEKMDIVIYRENTEDVYAGIEWAQGTNDAAKLRTYLMSELGSKEIREDSGFGIKPVSVTGTKRLVKKAIQGALQHGRKTVTLVHKGNIMKFTEGAFRDWGYELAKEQFSDQAISEEDFWAAGGGEIPKGKVMINDRIADSMFQQILLRPDEYSVLATPNLNGDYLSDAAAAQVGGLGLAPGANMGDHLALFEATHGTAPKYAGKDKVNPGSVILSGAMMFDYLGWTEAAEAVRSALARTIEQKRVTYDLERQMDGATLLKTSEFGDALVENMPRG